MDLGARTLIILVKEGSLVRLLHRCYRRCLSLLDSGGILLVAARLRIQLEEIVHLGSVDLADLLC